MSERRSTSLTTRTIRGVAWTLPTTLGSRIVGLVGTLLLARYLVREEYGEVMAGAIVTVTAFGVSTFGVGIYLLSNRELTRADIFHATCWFLGTGAAALGLAWAATPLLEDWLEAPRLGEFMPLFVLGAFLDRIVFLPERILIRQLRFKWLSLVRAASEIAFTVTSLVLARHGHEAMSIVWGFLARSALRFLLIVPTVGWREWAEPHRLRAATLRKIVRSGVAISVAGIATFLMRRWDNLLVSVFFGNAAMGAYNYAYNLADTPATAIGEQVSDVIAASFPHAEGEQRRAALVRACTMISLVMFPLAFGLAAVSETVVAAFFSREWASVGGMLMLLAVMSAPRPMAHILHSYLFACQRIRVVLWQEWMSLAILMAAIATIGRIGVLWTCGAVGAVFILRTLALMWTVQRHDGVPLRSFLVPLIRPLIACVAMVLAIVASRSVLGGLAPLARLAAEVLLGAVVYLLGARLIFRAAASEFLGLLRSAISRRAGGDRDE